MSLRIVLRVGQSTSRPAVATSTCAPAQVRGYAAAPPKNAKKVAAKFKSSGKDKGKQKRPARDSGLFQPMPVGALSHPVFQTELRAPLPLPMYRPETLTNAAIGTAMAFPDTESKALKAYGLPTNVLVDYMLLSKPCSVVREATVRAIDAIDGASWHPSADARFVLTGKGGCGKSYVLLQTVQYCIQKDWITLYIPRSISYLDSSTRYAYDARTRTYSQPELSKQLLKRFLDVNQRLVRGFRTQGAYPFDERNIAKSSPLVDLIQVGLDYQQHSTTVLSALLSELSQQEEHPVLLAMDDFQALYCTSLYRDPNFKPLKSYHLSLPRLLLEYASGQKSFARGVVVGALSTSHTGFRAPLELEEALGLTPTVPAGPYAKRAPELVNYARGLRNFPVPDQLTVDEAASIFDLWHQGKALHVSRGDEMFLSKYTEASGNARDFVQGGLLRTIAM